MMYFSRAVTCATAGQLTAAAGPWQQLQSNAQQPKLPQRATISPAVVAVNGTVTSEDGDPLIGTTVTVKDVSSVGTATDFEGKF